MALGSRRRRLDSRSQLGIDRRRGVRERLQIDGRGLESDQRIDLGGDIGELGKDGGRIGEHMQFPFEKTDSDGVINA